MLSWDGNPSHARNPWSHRQSVNNAAAIPRPFQLADLGITCRLDGRDLVFTTDNTGVTTKPCELIPGRQFTSPDGTRSFFTATSIIYDAAGYIFYSYVTAAGAQIVARLELSTGTITTVDVSANAISDDHTVPGLCLGPDSKLLVYRLNNQHNGILQVSKAATAHALDLGSWTTVDPFGDAAGYAYPNVFYLSGDNRFVMVARRATNLWGVSDSSDGITFANAANLHTTSANGWGTRPYWNVCWNGVDTFHLQATTSEGQENVASNGSQKLCYVKCVSGTWKKASNSSIGHGPPFTVAEIDTVLDLTATNDTLWDCAGGIAIREDGVSAKGTASRYEDGMDDTYTVHKLVSWHYNGSSFVVETLFTEGDGSWVESPLVYWGCSIHDPDDDDVLWVSKQTTGHYGDVYEMFEYRGGPGAWSQYRVITKDSPLRGHVRPMVAKGCPFGTPGRVQFMSPRSYASANSFVGGLTSDPPLDGIQIVWAPPGNSVFWYGNQDAHIDETDPVSLWVNAGFKMFYHGQQPYGAIPNIYTDSAQGGNALSGVLPATGPSADVGDGFSWKSGGFVLGTVNTLGWTAFTCMMGQKRITNDLSIPFASEISNGGGTDPFALVIDGGATAGAVLFTRIQDESFQPPSPPGTARFPTNTSIKDAWNFHRWGVSAAGGLVSSKFTIASPTPVHDAISSTTFTTISATLSGTWQLGKFAASNFFAGDWTDIGLTNNYLVTQSDYDKYADAVVNSVAAFTFGGEEDQSEGATYDETGVGGLVFGGSASAAKNYNVTASGGIVLGSSATPKATYNATASGGLAEGGSATDRCTYGTTGSGGVILGGSIVAMATYNVAAGGGVILGGQAQLDSSNTYNETASGGLALSGQAGAGRSTSDLAMGALSFSGTAATQSTNNMFGSGTIVLGGTAIGVGGTVSETGSGGLVLGGQAVVSSTGVTVTAEWRVAIYPAAVAIVKIN